MNLNTIILLLSTMAAIGWGHAVFADGAATDPGRPEQATAVPEVVLPAAAKGLPSASADDGAWAPATTRLNGPADQCLDMAKVVMCPFFSRLPFIREIVGQFAVWGRTSCPAS